MPYFPESVMPLSQKQNSVGAVPVGNAITSAEFNFIDEELQAVQKYLLGQGVSLVDFSKRVKDLTKETNQVALRQSFSNVLSGYCLSGMRVRFPETSSTWLTKNPAPNDREITVNTTRDFPSEGVISIINDVNQIQKAEDDTWISNVQTGVTTVEWIKYSGKTSDTFTGCLRGYMGTYPGTHSGYYVGNTNPTSAVNLRDHCPITPLKTVDRICQRRMNRPYVSGSFPLFGFTGTIEDITRMVMLDGTSFKLYPTNPYLETMRKAFSAISPVNIPAVPGGWKYVTDCSKQHWSEWQTWWEGNLYNYFHHHHHCAYYKQYTPAVPAQVTTMTPGVISYGIWREKWIYDSQNVLVLEYAFLQSDDYNHFVQGQLTGIEAYNFVQTALQYGAIQTSTYTSTEWPENGIPVFNGRLDISIGFSEWTYDNMPPQDDYMSPEAPKIILYADGTVAGYLDKFDTFSDVAQSVIGYSTKMIPGY